MVVDSSPQARDQVRTIAFIYFTCAQADRSWDNSETVALYEFLERQAGSLTREQIAGLAQDALRRHQELAGTDERIHEIEATAPVTLADLDHDARLQLLADLVGLARADGKVSRTEDFTIARIRHALQAEPRPPADAAPRDEEVRLLAFLFFTFADADDRWQSEETAALYDHLERHTGTAERERTIALAHDAHGTLLSIADTDARVAWLAERIPTVLAHRDVAARKQILKELVVLARADGKFSPAEGHTLEKIRELLLGPATLGTAE